MCVLFLWATSVVLFLTAERISVKNTATCLNNVYGEAAMPSQTVRSWAERFKTGHNNVHGDDRSGRPSDAVNDEITASILALFEQNWRNTITDLKVFLKEEFLIDVSRASICRVLQKAGFTKVCVRWVPRLLSDANHFDAALSFFCMYQNDKTILSRIVTGDKTWVLYITSETKQASKVWKMKDKRAPKKACIEKSANKLMVTVFWDHQGI